MTIPPAAYQPPPTPRPIHEIYQMWTLRRYAPPRLLVNKAYEIVYMFNGADRYLIEPDGVVTQNILQKIIPTLRLDVRMALYQAFLKQERTASRLLQVEIDGKPCLIQLHIGPVEEADFPQELVEVVFEERKEAIVIGANREASPAMVESALVARLQEELQCLREQMQTIMAEHENSIQELRAANEERYRTLFETMDEGFCIFEMLFDEANQPIDYRFLEVNPAFAHFTGLENAVGKTARELVPNLEAQWFDIYGQVALTGEPRRFVEGSTAMGRWFDVYAFRFGAPEARRVALLFNNITERKQIEDALRASEAQLYTILHNIPASVYMLTPDQRYLYVNHYYEKLAGITNAEIQGKSIYEMFTPETAAALAQNDLRALAAKTPLALEEFAPQDGEVHVYASIKTPLLDANGKPYALLGISTDITERKHAERNQQFLLDLDTQIRLLDDPDAILTTVAKHLGHYLKVAHCVLNEFTPAVEQGVTLVHWRRSDTLPDLSGNHQLWAMLGPDATARLADGRSFAANDVLHDPLTRELVARYVAAGVQTLVCIPFTAKVAPLAVLAVADEQPRTWRQDEVTLLENVMGRVWPLVTKVRAEAALRVSEAIARRRLDELEAIYKTAPVGLCVMDQELCYVRINDRLAAMNGYSAADHIGRAGRELFPDLGAKTDSALRHVLATGEAVIGLELTGEIPTQPGVEHTWIQSWLPLHDETGAVVAINIVVEEITERRRAEEALRTSEERLRLATEAGSVGIFDHDLLTSQIEISELFAHIIGFPPTAVITYEGWLARIYYEDRALVEAIWREARATGASYYYECRIVHPDGSLVWIEVNALVVSDEAGQGIRITGAIRDITERKQTALHQQFLLDLNAALRPLSEPEAIQQMVVERLGQYLGASRCHFNAIDLAADKTTLLAAWSAPGLPPPAAIIPLSTHTSPNYVLNAQAGRTLVVHDATDDTSPAIPQDLSQQHSFRASIRVPCLRDRQWVASLHLLQTTPRQWRPDEVRLVESVAHHCWPLVEKARAEATLRRHEEFLRQIADNVPGLIGYLGADERYRFVNAAFEAWFQRPRHQIVGHTVRELIGETERQRLSSYRQHALAGETVSYETVFAYPDGVTRTVWGRYHPDLTADGTVVGFYIFLMDITERKRAEEQLRASEEGLRLALAAAHMTTFEYNTATQTIRRSPNALLVQGLTKEAIPGEYYTYVHPADRDQLRQIIDGLTPAQASYEFEYRFIRPDNGVTIWLLDRAQAFFDSHGKLQRLMGVALDITQRKTAEADQRFLADLAEITRLTDDADELVAATVRLVGEQLQVGRCLWIEVDTARDSGFIRAQHCRNLPPVVAEYRNSDYSPTTRAELLAGHVLVNYDAKHDPRTAAFYDTIYAPQEERAYVGVPLLHEGQWCGILSVTSPTPRQWQTHEIHLLTTVTERVWMALEKLRLNAAVRQINERFTLAEAAVPGWIYDYDWQTGTVTRSDGFYRVLGYAPEECQPTAAWWQSLIHPDDWQWLVRELDPLAPRGNLRHLEYRVRDRSGHYHHMWDRARVMRNETGEIIRLVGSSVDISEHKQMEETLRASEARFRHLADAMPQLVWTCEEDGSITYINSQWSVYSGMTVDETLAHGMWPALHVDDQATNREQWRLALESGEPYEGEVRLRRHDGVYRWFLERAIPVRDETGAIEQWFGVSMDIADRKAAEETIRRQLAEIEAIYATAPVGLCLVDTDLRYLRINETLAAINGLTVAAQLGHTLRETGSAEGFHLVAPFYQYVIEHGEPLLNQEVHESYVDPAQARDWLASYYPLKTADGVVTGVNAVIVEITDRKRQERQLQELNAILDERVRERTAELEQANRELEQFNYAVAHDLRTPLRGIANLVQWISEDAATVLPATSQTHLAKLGGRVNRLEKMLEDMLIYSRIGRVRYAAEAVDTQQLVQNLVDLLTPPTGFTVNVPTPLPTFVTPRAPLEMVLRNLLSNAIKHHHRPPIGYVEITARELEDWIEFCIRDNGPGIAPEYHERIFGMFQTLKPRDQVEGSGIGLALVKKTLDSYGGQITVESTRGVGTTFRFTWPK